MSSSSSSPIQSTSQQHNTFYPHGLSKLPQGVSIVDAINRLGGDGGQITVTPLTQSSAFVIPKTVMYTLDGKSRRWDMVQSHPSVAILLYHKTRNAFILVRQFRPALYATAKMNAEKEGNPLPPLSEGFTFELCAGIIDKPGLSLEEIASEEVQEETGFIVDATKMHTVASFQSAVGISGSKQTIFAAVVDDSMVDGSNEGGGGGLIHHGEIIEVVALPVESVEGFIADDSLGKSSGLMFALVWACQRLKLGGELF